MYRYWYMYVCMHVTDSDDIQTVYLYHTTYKQCIFTTRRTSSIYIRVPSVSRMPKPYTYILYMHRMHKPYE